jgi:glycosyltransferase involved in cell wall biosynthesis
MKPLLYSILPRPPHPTRDGLAIRNYHLLAGLAGEFRVRAFALAPPHLAGRGEYPPGVEFEEIPQAAAPLRRTAALARSLVTGEAFPPLLYRSRRLTSRLADRAAASRPAWIVAHAYHVAATAPDSDVPLWVDFHNVDSEIWRRLGERAAGPTGVFLRSQAPRIARVERDLAGRAAGASCVSERDARTLAQEGGPSAFVVKNGVDLARYAFRAEPSTEERIFFVGDLSWPPNAEGIRWFCEEVWPLVARLSPGASVDVLGRGAGAALPRLVRKPPAGVAFLGEGDDTRPHWGRAAVAIVPLLAGGGTRLKILEAAACGVPVVSTPVGAEGLDFAGGSEIRLAAGAGQFADAVASLLSDREARRAQAAAARRRVESGYDWREIGRRFAEELTRRIRPK